MTLLDQLRQNRNDEAAKLDALLSPIVTAKRAATADEETAVEASTSAIKQLDARISDLIAQEESRQQAEASYARLGIADIRVKSEPRTYERSSMLRRNTSYFRDLWGARQGNPGALERLARHAQEVDVIARDNPDSVEARALSTTDGSGGFPQVAALAA